MYCGVSGGLYAKEVHTHSFYFLGGLADDSIASVLKALVAMDGPLPPADWSKVVLPHLRNS